MGRKVRLTGVYGRANSFLCEPFGSLRSNRQRSCLHHNFSGDRPFDSPAFEQAPQRALPRTSVDLFECDVVAGQLRRDVVSGVCRTCGVESLDEPLLFAHLDDPGRVFTDVSGLCWAGGAGQAAQAVVPWQPCRETGRSFGELCCDARVTRARGFRTACGFAVRIQFHHSLRSRSSCVRCSPLAAVTKTRGIALPKEGCDRRLSF